MNFLAYVKFNFSVLLCYSKSVENLIQRPRPFEPRLDETRYTRNEQPSNGCNFFDGTIGFGFGPTSTEIIEIVRVYPMKN